LIRVSGAAGEFTQTGTVNLGSGTVTYRPGSGTDPDFVNPDIDWDGYGDAMNSLTYGSSKGYYIGASGGQFNAVDFSDYSSQSGSGTFALESEDTAIRLTGNTWRKAIFNYEVTENTMIRVTVNATDTGELIGIGFDTNNNFNDSLASNVKIGGSQATPDKFVNVSEFYIAGSGPVTYEIPIGSYISGTMSYLTFVADDDADSSADVVFSEIEVFEQTDSIVFDIEGFSGYASQTSSGTVSLDSNGQAIHLTGNTWQRYAMSTTITADTVLEVTVDAPDTGEIIGIGFDTNNAFDDIDTNFRLGGSQSVPSQFFGLSPSYISGDGEVTYVIPVGSYFTGSMNYITFIADDDTASPATDVTFSNIRIYDSMEIGGAISVNLADAGSELAATDLAGVIAMPNWNNSTLGNETLSNVIDDAGMATTADFAFGGTPYYYTNATPTYSAPYEADSLMMRGTRAQSNSSATSVTISEVPYAVYDVYVYWGGRKAGESVPAELKVEYQTESGGVWTALDTRYMLDTDHTWDGFYNESVATTTGTATDGNEYVVFRNQTASSFKIRGTCGRRTGFNAVQIIER
jgi:hypothetical protein